MFKEKVVKITTTKKNLYTIQALGFTASLVYFHKARIVL
jgi:hypothetical protein